MSKASSKAATIRCTFTVSCLQVSQGPLHPAKADALLLQPNPDAQFVITQIVEQRSLVKRQARQITQQGLRLLAPMVGMRQQGFTIHQQRLGMGKTGA